MCRLQEPEPPLYAPQITHDCAGLSATKPRLTWFRRDPTNAALKRRHLVDGHASPRMRPSLRRHVPGTHKSRSCLPGPRSPPSLIPHAQRRVSLSFSLFFPHAQRCVFSAPQRARSRTAACSSRCARSAARFAPKRARGSSAACPELKRAISLGRPDHDLRMKLGPREPARPGHFLHSTRL